VPRRLGTAVLAVLFHGSLLCWLCWPLPSTLATHLPNPNLTWDRLLLGWALAHQSRALAGEVARYGDANIYTRTRTRSSTAKPGSGPCRSSRARSG
jgi:hypothetical protein